MRLGAKSGASRAGAQQPSCWVPLPASHPRYAGACSTSSPAVSEPIASRHQRAGCAQPQPSLRLTPCRSSTSSSAASSSSPDRSLDLQQQQPWTREDLERMTQELEQEREAELGQQWRSNFQDDPEELFEYAATAAYQWEAVLRELKSLPKAEWEDAGVEQHETTLPAPLAAELVGMGTWRLKSSVDPAIQFLVTRLEGTWREILDTDLNMYPSRQWKGKWDICDSMDPKRELEGWSYADVPPPEKGQEGYPRLILENRLYCSRVFRKLHLEVGWRQDGLQVLHAVMYPRLAYDTPILAMDLVVSKGVVTLAIIDACPVRKNKYLPPHYIQTMQELQEVFLVDAANARRIPEWGQNIFSPACVCIRPETPAELAGFLKYAVALHRAHMQLSRLLEPVNGSDPRGAARLAEIKDGHQRFVDNQLANKKTARVLEVAFGEEWTNQYMREVMFDCPKDASEEPPYYEDLLGSLYDLYDERPEYGAQAEDVAELLDDMAMSRAEEVIDQLARGQRVRQDRVETALQTLYERDPEFRTNCQLLLPGLLLGAGGSGPRPVGAYLARHLKDLGLGEVQESWVK